MSMIKNRAAFSAHLNGYLPEKKRDFEKRVERIAGFIHKSLLAKTPVWQGETIANYQWSIDVPKLGTVAYSTSPAETGETNMMPLGVEPRRASNEAIANGSFAALQFRGSFGRVIYVTNNADQWGGLEAGDLPVAPLQSRSPLGMMGVTLQEVKSRLDAGVL